MLSLSRGALFAIVLLLPAVSGAQIAADLITADSITQHAAADSGGTFEQYEGYGKRLAKTLGVMTPEQLARIFEGVVTVQVPETLNEQLGLNPITYGLNEIDLTEEGMAELDKVAEYLNLNSSARILIEGHTQFDGGSISEDRANAAKAYLEQLGISPDRIEAVGLNNTDPLVESPDRTVTQVNRRIEIHTID